MRKANRDEVGRQEVVVLGLPAPTEIVVDLREDLAGDQTIGAQAVRFSIELDIAAATVIWRCAQSGPLRNRPALANRHTAGPMPVDTSR